jgi:hypothetical protein
MVAIPCVTGLIFGFGYLPRGILFAPLENCPGVFGVDLDGPANHQGFIVRLYSGQLLMADDLMPASHDRRSKPDGRTAKDKNSQIRLLRSRHAWRNLNS